MFTCVRMCKSNGGKRWTKQDILRVFWNIQPNHAHKMGVSLWMKFLPTCNKMDRIYIYFLLISSAWTLITNVPLTLPLTLTVFQYGNPWTLAKMLKINSPVAVMSYNTYILTLFLHLLLIFICFNQVSVYETWLPPPSICQSCFQDFYEDKYVQYTPPTLHPCTNPHGAVIVNWLI